MQLSRYLYVPYQLVRRPLAVVDKHAVSRLAPENRIRTTYRDALGAADTVMALILGEPGLAGSRESDRVRSTEDGKVSHEQEPDEQMPDEPVSDHAASVADDQRRKAFAQKEERVARANRSPAAMKRDLARMHAVVEAREHSAVD